MTVGLVSERRIALAIGDELIGMYHGLLEAGLSDTATAA